MSSKHQKRIFIGGLAKGVTEQELEEKFSRFGQVDQIEIKTRSSDAGGKTFAYINLTAGENDFKKCFTAFNNTKWRGGLLKLQLAKESFITKLEQERTETEGGKVKTSVVIASSSPALESQDKKAVPSTPMDDKGNWVVGKYSRILPVLHVKKPGSKKIITLDPSKTTHLLKKLKSGDDRTSSAIKLTWHMEEAEDSDMSKRRQGHFPTWTSPKPGSISARLQGLAAQEYDTDTEMEIVAVTDPVKKTEQSELDCQSDDSADTDEIIFKASHRKSKVLSSGNEAKNALAEDNPRKLMIGNVSSHLSFSGSPNAADIQRKTQQNKSAIALPSSLGTKKHLPQSSAKSGFSDLADTQRPQFQFVKTENVYGKCFRKSVKQNQSRTLPFKGLCMLSDDDERGEKQTSENPDVKDGVNKLPKKLKKSVASDLEKVEDDKLFSSSKKLGLKLDKKVHSDVPHKAFRFQTLSQKEVVADSGSTSDSLSSSKILLGTADKQVHGKKDAGQIADMPQMQRMNKTSTSQRSTTAAAFPNVENPKNCKVGGFEATGVTSMEKSHKARKRNLEEVKRLENLITKSIREGTGSKHVIFSNSDDEGNVASEPNSKRSALFGLSDSEDESKHDFSIRPQFEGKKGQKLMKLQSKFKDTRFRIDERFAESEDEEKEIEEDSHDEEMANEKARNMEILEKVLGHKLWTKKIINQDMSTRRYLDPVRSKHLEINQEDQQKKKEEPYLTEELSDKTFDESSDHSDGDSTGDDNDIPSRSQDVTEAQADSSDSEEDGNEEGSGEEDGNEDGSGEEGNEDSVRIAEEEESALSEKEKVASISSEIHTSEKLGSLFSGGSAFSFFETPVKQSPPEKNGPSATHSKAEEAEPEPAKDEISHFRPKGDKKQTVAVTPRPFIIAVDDPRLKVAVKFFQRPTAEDYQAVMEGWPEERHKLMQLVREQHKRAVRKERKLQRQEQWETKQSWKRFKRKK